MFKESFDITPPNSYFCPSSYPKTTSWNRSTDCCTWEGVTCDNISSQVIELDLGCSQLRGTIVSNNSLFHLSHLQRLNLAYNDIGSSGIENLFGNFTNLTHLNLSSSEFIGEVPYEIMKLTELTSLDLSFTSFTIRPNIFKLLLTNFTKLSQVSLTALNILSSIPKNLSSSLEILDLQLTNLQGELPQSIFHLPNLKTLILTQNYKLHGVLPSVRWNSHATLETLELSFVSFSGKIPDSIGDLKALKYLRLADCGFNGSLPKGLFNNMTLIELDLSSNSLTGSLPSFPIESKYLRSLYLYGNSFTGTLMQSRICSLSSLEYLELRSNQFHGTIPMELSNLVNLKWLALSSNNFSGYVDVDIFSYMKQLKTLYLSPNRLSLVIKENSSLPESIQNLGFASCNITELGFLRSVVEFSDVDLSMNNIQEIPSWLWSKWNNILSLNISYNSITHIGQLDFSNVEVLDIRSNLFQGPFPQIPRRISNLFISHNQFFGVIPPSIMCGLSSMYMLDLSNNGFTGSMPHCLGNMSQNLYVLDMSMNKFEGIIPSNFSSRVLETINLHGNYLQGNIPSSFSKCINLKVLDLGNNNLNGSFPSWLGSLPNLTVLSLRSNNLHGKIRFPSPTSFSNLQILDLSHNQFFGTLIPMFFKSLMGMMEIVETGKSANYIGVRTFTGYYMDSTFVVNKGIEIKLVRILTTWATIDLSCNNFEGSIPSSIGSLISLRQFNVSNNRFTGEIPISLENLSFLESLDMSTNQLIGTIPTQLTNLHSLTKLNLSNNHLSGRIPSGPQLQTFESDSYINNDGLCGFPLLETCADQVPEVDSDDSIFIDGFSWRSVLTGYGVGMLFGLGVGCVMILTRKPQWLTRIVEEEGQRIVMKRTRKKKIVKLIGRT